MTQYEMGWRGTFAPVGEGIGVGETGFAGGSTPKLLILFEEPSFWQQRSENRGWRAREEGKVQGWHKRCKCMGVAHAYSKTVELTASKTSLTPCILDDDHSQLDLLSAVMNEMGYEAVTTSDPEEALGLVRSGKCRLVLADVNMPGMGGYEFLDRALRSDPGIHVIVMTGEYTLESALDAIRRGATDFLPKPIDRIRLKRTLDEVATIYDQRKRVRALEEQLLKDLEFHGIVGKSPVMLEVFDFARKVARHYTNVLLVGSTGTGKSWWHGRFTTSVR
jgi:CheY-like chemotaxis protein